MSLGFGEEGYREAQTRTWGGPPWPQFHEKTSPRENKERILRREGEKEREIIFGPRPVGPSPLFLGLAPTLRATTLRAPTLIFSFLFIFSYFSKFSCVFLHFAFSSTFAFFSQFSVFYKKNCFSFFFQKNVLFFSFFSHFSFFQVWGGGYYLSSSLPNWGLGGRGWQPPSSSPPLQELVLRFGREGSGGNYLPKPKTSTSSSSEPVSAVACGRVCQGPLQCHQRVCLQIV